MIGVPAHKVDSWELKLLLTVVANFLVKVPCCAFHFGDLVLEVVDVVLVFVQLLLGSFDLVLLGLQVLEKEFSEHAEFKLFVFLENFKY